MLKLACLNYPYEESLKHSSNFLLPFLDSFSSKSDSETLQHEVLTDNYKLKNFEICYAKLLLRMLDASV